MERLRIVNNDLSARLNDLKVNAGDTQEKDKSVAFADDEEFIEMREKIET